MAVYDIDADASTAVTAWLAQFTVTAEGNIRFSTGIDTFHVYWIHRGLQKVAWDFEISGDDEINLSKPNPSTSEAIGTIITLLDHTAAYSVGYNITDTEAEYHFGGSLVQGASGAETRYSGLITVGSVASGTTELQIISDNALLTSHWSTGKNQTSSQTLIRILVKTIDAGTEIDGSRVIVKASEWGDTFAVWRTELGLGEKVAAINTATDPNNTTSQATVEAYVGISNVEGYQLIDINDGSGDKDYYSKWTYGGNDKKALYEWVKALMVRDTSATIYGLDGDFFTGGPTFKADIDGGSGTWVQSEVVTWTESGTVSSGRLMAVDNLTGASATEIWIHILTGINPIDGTTLTGAGGATGDINASITNLIASPNHLGVYTGAWIGDYGVGFVAGELTVADSIKPLDGTGPLSPPNNVPLSVTVNGTTNAHVFLAIKDGGTGGVDYTQYTVDTATSGTTSFIIAESIASDTPPSGWILVKEGTTFEPIEYTSWTGSTFTVASLGTTYTAAKDVIIPLFYDNVATDGGTASSSLIYSSSIDAVGWVRHGEPGSPHKPVAIAGTVGSAGLSLSVTLESE